MRTFKGEWAQFSFSKCPIYIHDGASAKISTNSHEIDNSVAVLAGLLLSCKLLSLPAAGIAFVLKQPITQITKGMQGQSLGYPGPPSRCRTSDFPRHISFLWGRVLQSCTLIKKNVLIYKEIQSGGVAKSYMRKGFLIYEEMRKYFPIYVLYGEAVSHIWLCNCSNLNFLAYAENLIFFLSVCVCNIITCALDCINTRGITCPGLGHAAGSHVPAQGR